MAGKIIIGPDFDELPDEMAFAFGMKSHAGEGIVGHSPANGVLQAYSGMVRLLK